MNAAQYMDNLDATLSDQNFDKIGLKYFNPD